MTQGIWWNVKGVVSGLAIVALLTWVVMSPSHKKESYEKTCKYAGGVVAYTLKIGEPVCVKP